MASPVALKPKAFLYNHSSIVDFLCASLIISICLIVLLPKVHESFLPHENDVTFSQFIASVTTAVQSSLADTTTTTKTTTTTAIPGLAIDDGNVTTDPQGPKNGVDNPPPPAPHHHHHNHRFPTGELLICMGFFVFYCIGLGLRKEKSHKTRGSTIENERKISTVCCSSLRCPLSQREPRIDTSDGNQAALKLTNEAAETDTLIGGHKDLEDDDNCVMLLNRHHTHHTHRRHHDHNVNTAVGNQSYNQQTVKRRSGYGSMINSNVIARPDLSRISNGIDTGYQTGLDSHPTMIVVEEIRIRASPIEEERTLCGQDEGCWPLATKVFLFSLIFAGILILFDMNVLGVIKAIKVFRAASTGALLYLAFFIILPQGPAGCNSCKEEDAQSP